jgi:predicted metal-binding transcription factor (methanogenesis marker protein 9)
MSSNSDFAKGLILINGQAYEAKEVLKALEQQAMTSVRVVGGELWVGKHRVRAIPKITPEQAMKLTCYGSLAYCCDLSRECQLRDEAIHHLGITKNEFNVIQQDCHRQFLQSGECRWPQDSLSRSSLDQSQVSSYTREYSRPEPHDPWREQTSSARRSATHSSPSSSTVDLGGLFGAPDEYKARSLTDPDPFARHTGRTSDHSSGFVSSADLGFPMQVQRPQPWLPLTPSACIVGRIFKMDVSSVLGVGGVKGKKHEPSL